MMPYGATIACVSSTVRMIMPDPGADQKEMLFFLKDKVRSRAE